MTSNIKLLSFDGNRYGGLPKRLTRKNPRSYNIRGLFLVKRLGKPILHYDTEFGKSVLFAKRS